MARTLEEELAILRAMKPTYEPAIDHRSERQRTMAGSVTARTNYTVEQLDEGINNGSYVAGCECPFCRACMYLIANRSAEAEDRAYREQVEAANSDRDRIRDWQDFMNRVVDRSSGTRPAYTAASSWHTYHNAGGWTFVDETPSEEQVQAVEQLGDPQEDAPSDPMANLGEMAAQYANLEWDQLENNPFDAVNLQVNAAREEVESIRAGLDGVVPEAQSDESVRDQLQRSVRRMAEIYGIPEGGQIYMEWVGTTTHWSHMCISMTQEEANARTTNLEPALCGASFYTLRDARSTNRRCHSCDYLTRITRIRYQPPQRRQWNGSNVGVIGLPSFMTRSGPVPPVAGHDVQPIPEPTVTSPQEARRWMNSTHSSHWVIGDASSSVCGVVGPFATIGSFQLQRCNECERWVLGNEW